MYLRQYKLDIFLQKFVQWDELLSQFRNILSVELANPMYRWSDLTDVGSFSFLRKLSMRSSRGVMPFVVMLRPRSSVFGCPKAHFDIESFKPAFCICWKTASMLATNSSTLLAATPMS